MAAATALFAVRLLILEVAAVSSLVTNESNTEPEIERYLPARKSAFLSL